MGKMTKKLAREHKKGTKNRVEKSRYPKPINLVDFQGLRSENENWVILG